MITNTFISDTAPNTTTEQSSDAKDIGEGRRLSERITPQIADAIDRGEEAVRKGVDVLRTTAKSSADRAFEAVSCCTDYVAKHPLSSIATATAVGVIVGVLFGRRNG